MRRDGHYAAAAAAPWAVGGSVIAHVAAIAAAVLVFSSPPPGAVSTGVAGVEVMLGPIGAAAPEEPKPVEKVEAPPVEPEEPEPLVQPEPPVEQLEDVVAGAAPEEVEVEPAEEAKVEPPPEPRVKAKPEPKPEAPRRPVVRKPPEVQTATKAIDNALAGMTGPVDAKVTPDAANGDNSAGGGRAGAPADYLARLRAWLERHKDYPRTAQLRHIEGTVLIAFVMDRDGHVLSSRITRTSGHVELDRAVEQMIERAQPLPKIPDDMPQTQLSLVVPIQFYLR
jgi:protein TonB